IIAGILLAATTYYYKEKLESFLAEAITREAKAANVMLTFDDFSLGLSGASAKAANLFLPKALLSFSIENPAIRLPLIRALTLRPGAVIKADLYGGKLVIDGGHSLKDGVTEATLDLSGLQFSSIPQLAFLQPKSGTLNLSVGNLKL